MFGNPEAANYFQSQILEKIDTSANDLCPSKDGSVVNGYKAIYRTTAEKFLLSGVGHIELLLWATGSPATEEQILSIQVTLQHPFSQGRVYINSSDPFDNPVIDPQYFSHFADLVSLREGVKLLKKIGRAPPLSEVLTDEVLPGPSVTTDEGIEAFVRNTVESEFHLGSTLAMLPRDQGGVVDAKLKVYGLGNVRVVDASVFPFALAAHVSPFPLTAISGSLTQLFSFKHQSMLWQNRRRTLFAMTGDKGRLDPGQAVALRATGLLVFRVVSGLLARVLFPQSPWPSFSSGSHL